MSWSRIASFEPKKRVKFHLNAIIKVKIAMSWGYTNIVSSFLP